MTRAPARIPPPRAGLLSPTRRGTILAERDGEPVDNVIPWIDRGTAAHRDSEGRRLLEQALRLMARETVTVQQRAGRGH